MIVDGAGVKRIQAALRLRVKIKPARVEKVVKYRCTECDEVYDTMEQAARCHWMIAGVEEVHD
jgi:hypothetical protein